MPDQQLPPRGPQTTEFWLSAASLVLGVLLIVLGEKNGSESLQTAGSIMASASGFGYAISRGIAKR